MNINPSNYSIPRTLFTKDLHSSCVNTQTQKCRVSLPGMHVLHCRYNSPVQTCNILQMGSLLMQNNAQFNSDELLNLATITDLHSKCEGRRRVETSKITYPLLNNKLLELRAHAREAFRDEHLWRRLFTSNATKRNSVWANSNRPWLCNCSGWSNFRNPTT